MWKPRIEDGGGFTFAVVVVAGSLGPVEMETGHSSSLMRKKGHLSHDIQTLTQYSHTNACYCDTYPQINAYIPPVWSRNDVSH